MKQLTKKKQLQLAESAASSVKATDKLSAVDSDKPMGVDTFEGFDGAPQSTQKKTSVEDRESDSTKQSSQLDSRQKKLNESLAARRKRPMVRKVVGPAPSSSDSSTDEELEKLIRAAKSKSRMKPSSSVSLSNNQKSSKP